MMCGNDIDSSIFNSSYQGLSVGFSAEWGIDFKVGIVATQEIIFCKCEVMRGC
jgi:hypothetical protein